MRSVLKRITALRVCRSAWLTLSNQFGFNMAWMRGLARLSAFHAEFRAFRRLNQGSAFVLRGSDIFPCLVDRTATNPIEPTYFLQDTWFARKISEQRPSGHVDVGSSVKSMAMVAQFVPLTFVDIRTVEIELANFTSMKGTVLALPFADRSLASISSLCVIEHIGLGRYGDELNAKGSEKAAAELWRVLAPGGDLYVSVPIDAECHIYFNAHRAFTPEYLLSLFPGHELLDQQYIYGNVLRSDYEASRGFGTGLYHLRRS